IKNAPLCLGLLGGRGLLASRWGVILVVIVTTSFTLSGRSLSAGQFGRHAAAHTGRFTLATLVLLELQTPLMEKFIQILLPDILLRQFDKVVNLRFFVGNLTEEPVHAFLCQRPQRH